MKYFLKTLKIVGIILAIPIALYVLYLFLHLILAVRNMGSFPKFPNDQPVIIENDICLFFGVDGGSGDHLSIGSFSCKKLQKIQDEYKPKRKDSSLASVRRIAYENGVELLRLDSSGGSHCSTAEVITTKNKKYIKINEDRFCTNFLNGFFMEKKEDEFYRVNEQGIFIQGTFDESENFVDLILEETEKE